MNCIPAFHVLRFGNHTLSKPYRAALYTYCPYFTTEEVVGSFLGHNPNFPSQQKWEELQRNKRRRQNDASDSEDHYEEFRVEDFPAPPAFEDVLSNWQRHAQFQMGAKDLKPMVLQKATDILVGKANDFGCAEFDGVICEADELFSEGLLDTPLWQAFVHRKMDAVESRLISSSQLQESAIVDLVFGLSSEICKLSNNFILQHDIDSFSYSGLRKQIDERLADKRIWRSKRFEQRVTTWKALDFKAMHNLPNLRMIYVKWA